MKKLLYPLAALVLAALLPITALAQSELAATDATVQPGETVYITVSLNTPLEGTTLGVSTVFDEELLAPAQKGSRWQVKGLLSDFNEKGMGVWTTSEVVTLQGDMVVLAFRTLSDQPFSTEVVCTLIVKNGSEEVGRFDATATVTQQEPQPTAQETTGAAEQTEGTVFVTKPAETIAAPTQPTSRQTTDSGSSPSWLLWVLLGLGGAAVAAGGAVMRKRHLQ